MRGVRGTAPAILVIWIVAVGVWMKRQLVPSHRYLPWHRTPLWLSFLDVYDRLASQYFEGCDSRLVSTRFGDTHVFACGSAAHPPLLFFHGAASSSLMFGRWLLPAFKHNYYSIALDYPCDTGRSVPPNGDVGDALGATGTLARGARRTTPVQKSKVKFSTETK
jgi:hypothetical protein